MRPLSKCIAGLRLKADRDGVVPTLVGHSHRRSRKQNAVVQLLAGAACTCRTDLNGVQATAARGRQLRRRRAVFVEQRPCARTRKRVHRHRNRSD
jgi:hypothetical protein